MKKAVAMFMAVTMAALMMAGCGSDTAGSGSGAQATPGTEKEDSQEESGASGGPINVISREDGSGTRGAFIELFGIEEKNESGEKVDMTTEEAEITNNTSVMMTTVAGDASAIGYISLGSLNETVKAVRIDGAEPTAENVKSGEYKVSRPFNIVTKSDLSDVAKDFVDYIMSSEGQKVVEEAGYIALDNASPYAGNKPSGKVVVAGSSSVSPVMEKLAESYKKLNSKAEIEVQQSDSTTGITSANDGLCDIGMASRELKDSEKSLGLTATVIATDGIAVIVNKDNGVSDLSSEQVKGIYTDEIKDWSEVSK